MWKPISKNVHGVIDYAYGIIVPLLPEVAGFEEVTPAKNICRGLGAGAVGYALVTRAKWGIYPLLPFKKHLLLDISVSIAAIAAPWLLGFSNNTIARNTLVSVGLAGISAALMTDPLENDEQKNRYLFI